MPTKGGKRFMTSAIDFCPRQPLPVAQGLANGQHRRISSLLLRTGTSGVVLNRFRRHLRQCWFDLVESVQIGVYYDKHSIAHSTLDPLLQWVETNQSNLRITNLRMTRQNPGRGFKSRCLYYKHMTIVNDDSSVISKWSSKLIDNARGVIYDHRVFIIQARCWRMGATTLSTKGLLVTLSIIKLPLCWMSLCWVSLGWMSLCRVSWRRRMMSQLNVPIYSSKLCPISRLFLISADRFLHHDEGWVRGRKVVRRRGQVRRQDAGDVAHIRQHPQPSSRDRPRVWCGKLERFHLVSDNLIFINVPIFIHRRGDLK